jgi:hypothetical protein
MGFGVAVEDAIGVSVAEVGGVSAGTPEVIAGGGGSTVWQASTVKANTIKIPKNLRIRQL